jgi:hypothetical protein
MLSLWLSWVGKSYSMSVQNRANMHFDRLRLSGTLSFDCAHAPGLHRTHFQLPWVKVFRTSKVIWHETSFLSIR